MATKLINGIRYEMTSEEEISFNNSRAKTFDEAMEDLRTKRDKLLSATDYLALSDNTLSTEMTTYRQALRDITEGVTTVEQVQAVVFPTKP